MDKPFYTVQEVADLLGLHVKTVRRYVHEGLVASTRLGKRYRISRESLASFTGTAIGEETRAPLRGLRVSSIVEVDGIGRDRANHLTTFLVASAGARDEADHLRVDCIYDEEASVLKVIVIGSLRSTTVLLDAIDTLAGAER